MPPDIPSSFWGPKIINHFGDGQLGSFFPLFPSLSLSLFLASGICCFCFGCVFFRSSLPTSIWAANDFRTVGEPSHIHQLPFPTYVRRKGTATQRQQQVGLHRASATSLTAFRAAIRGSIAIGAGGGKSLSLGVGIGVVNRQERDEGEEHTLR